MRAGMSYFHETIWKGVPKFLRRVDTALKNIGIDERVPYNAPLIQFSSWMGGDRDGIILFRQSIHGHFFNSWEDSILSKHCFIFSITKTNGSFLNGISSKTTSKIMMHCSPDISLMWMAGNPRVTPEVTRDVCLLARMMAANLYYSQIEELMFEVHNVLSSL